MLRSKSKGDKVFKGLKVCVALYEKPIVELQTVTCHMGSPAIEQRWACPALISAKQADARFTCPGGTQG